MNRIDPTTSLRHGALERLRFIDARLFWEARINRADLIETFSVSPAQAALDFKEYLKMAGRGVVYDTRSKAYVRATSFKPAFGAPDAGKALSDMLAAGDSLVATLPKLERPLDPCVVARVRLAARSAERLRVEYQSFTRPQPQKRWIAPRQLVSDGERWHARCWCYEHNEWRDFVLARIAAIDAAEPAGQLPRDRDWENAYRLVLKPAEDRRKVKERPSSVNTRCKRGGSWSRSPLRCVSMPSDGGASIGPPRALRCLRTAMVRLLAIARASRRWSRQPLAHGWRRAAMTQRGQLIALSTVGAHGA